MFATRVMRATKNLVTKARRSGGSAVVVVNNGKLDVAEIEPIADSGATTIAELKDDHNALLAALRDANVIQTAE